MYCEGALNDNDASASKSFLTQESPSHVGIVGATASAAFFAVRFA